MPLEIGDIAPAFQLTTPSGEIFDPAADHIAGKLLVLAFPANDAASANAFAHLAPSIAGAGGCLAIIQPGIGKGLDTGNATYLADPGGKVRQAYGVDGRTQIVVIAPNRHVAAVLMDSAVGDGDLAGQVLAAIEKTRLARSDTNIHPPVLIVPDVLSQEDCRRLMTIFAMQGQTFVEPGHGAPQGLGDYKMRIPEYGRKDRIDHWIMQPETNAFIDDRLRRRLFPEILKSFQYRISRREGYRIGCYEGERGGESHGHRDNTQPRVAHRRFACSINLNTRDFEGGGLLFPEFGARQYRPESGAAIVFSCSLLHEALHVTAGRRYVLLAFLYGEH